MAKKNKNSNVESVISDWLNYGEIELFYSRESFDTTINKHSLIEDIIENFFHQHPLGEWKLLFPLFSQNKEQSAEKAIVNAKSFSKNKLPDALYFVTLLVMYQSLCSAFNETVKESIMKELEHQILQSIRGTVELTHESRGTNRKWNQDTLRDVIRRCMQRIGKPKCITQMSVALEMTNLIPERFLTEEEIKLSKQAPPNMLSF